MHCCLHDATHLEEHHKLSCRDIDTGKDAAPTIFSATNNEAPLEAWILWLRCMLHVKHRIVLLRLNLGDDG